MMEIAEQPLAKRLWRMCKFFNLPLNDERMQALDIYDIEFYEMSMIAEDPDKLNRYKNSFYDTDYDDWVEDFEKEQDEINNAPELKISKENQKNDNYITKEEKINSEPFESELEQEYEVSLPFDDLDDWEEV